MAIENKTYITGFFEDESDLLNAVRLLKDKKVKIWNVLTPFPVHGLDKVLTYKRSGLPKVGFIGGAIGAICGLGFQAWVFTEAYQLNFGGKPYLSIPSFIPVTFECTVLFTAFAMLFAFLFRSKLGLGAQNPVLDERITDDRFVIAIDPKHKTNQGINIKQELEKCGAQNVKESKNYGTTL